MGSMSVSSCICCMFVSCVHPVAVLNAAFCMTCSLLMTSTSSLPAALLFFSAAIPFLYSSSLKGCTIVGVTS